MSEHDIAQAAYLTELEASHARLRQWLAVVLDQVDYTNGACGLTEMVGAVLEPSVIENARQVLKQVPKGGDEAA